MRRSVPTAAAAAPADPLRARATLPVTAVPVTALAITALAIAALAGLPVATPALAVAPAAVQDDGRSAGPVTPDSADAIRDALVRPPPAPPFDAIDAVALPFRAVTLPIRLIGRGATSLAGAVPVPRAPTVFGRILADMARVGLRPSIGSIGPRSGIAGRLRYEPALPIFLETGISVRGSQRHRGGVRHPAGPVALEAAYTFQRNAAPHFWGVGADSPEESRADYLWDRQLVELRAAARLGILTLYGGPAWEDNRVGRGFDEGTTDLQERPRTDALFGLRERTEFARLDAAAALDLTRAAGLQRRGAHVELGGSLYRGVDGTDADFHRIRGAAHGYLPLNPRQSLALRGIFEMNRLDGGAGVPFTHLAELGDAEGARAYPDGRFRDRDRVALMSEWRYEIWRELHERARAESFVFVDIGGVASRVSDLDGSDLRESYGFGFRFVTRHDLWGLAFLAFGEEGARLQAAFDWAY